MKKLLLTAVMLSLLAAGTYAQKAQANDSTMLTIFLRHQEDKNLKEINAKLAANGYNQQFPPKFARVVSWYVLMGIGQVVTLKFPANRLRDLNLIFENTAWGAFNTEFYPTYDYMPVWKQTQQNKSQ